MLSSLIRAPRRSFPERFCYHWPARFQTACLHGLAEAQVLSWTGTGKATRMDEGCMSRELPEPRSRLFLLFNRRRLTSTNCLAGDGYCANTRRAGRAMSGGWVVLGTIRSHGCCKHRIIILRSKILRIYMLWGSMSRIVKNAQRV